MIPVGKLLPRATVWLAVAYGVWPTVSETLWPPFCATGGKRAGSGRFALGAKAAAASRPRPFQRQTDYATAAGGVRPT